MVCSSRHLTPTLPISRPPILHSPRGTLNGGKTTSSFRLSDTTSPKIGFWRPDPRRRFTWGLVVPDFRHLLDVLSRCHGPSTHSSTIPWITTSLRRDTFHFPPSVWSIIEHLNHKVSFMQPFVDVWVNNPGNVFTPSYVFRERRWTTIFEFQFHLCIIKDEEDE